MKLNIKKITSVLASTALLGSTVFAGFAAAATYPAPFISGGTADVAVVVGVDAAGSDFLAAIDVGQDLQAELAKQTATTGSGSGGSAVTDGDSVKLERSSDMFNLGENMSKFYTKMDDDELATVLASGEYLDDDNDDFEYNQEIALGTNLQLTHFQNDDLQDEPIVGFDLADGDHILNYTLDFSPDDAESAGETDWGDFEQTDITILGKEYFIVSATNSSESEKLTLLDAANTITVTEGETSTLEVGDTSYEVSIQFIDGTDVMLNVNGETTNKLGEGDTYEIASDVFAAVKTNLYNSKTGTTSSAEISIGEGEIVLENGQEVVINDEDVDGLTSYITQTSSKLDKIVLEWNLDDDDWLTVDEKLVMPGFETIEIAMGNWNADEAEEITVANNGDAMKLTVPITDGEETFDFLYGNGTTFLGVGEESGKELLTSNGTTISVTDASKQEFVVSWEDGTEVESYVLEITKIDDTDGAKNTTTIKSTTDSSTGASLDIDETIDIGRIDFTLTAADEDADTATLTVAAVSSGNVYLDRIYSVEGLMVELPWEHMADNYTLDPGEHNSIWTNTTGIGYAGGDTSFVLKFTEEDENNNLDSGEHFNLTLGFDSTEAKPEVSSAVTFESGEGHETGSSTDIHEGYVESPLATKTVRDADSDLSDVVITYNGDEAYADVFVTEAGATITTTDSTTTDGEVTELGSVTFYDNELTAEAKAKNLIVVGGSCINTVAGEMLGGNLCGADFTDTTGVGEGQFLIKAATSPYNEDKVAMLVAGYEAADTQKAVTYLTQETPVTTDTGTEVKKESTTYADVTTTEETTDDETTE